MAAPSNDKADFIEIGVLTRPHGLRGEIKLRLHDQGSQALRHTQQVVLELPSGASERKEISRIRGAGRELIAELTGVESRESADTLKGAKVWVRRGDLPPLEPGEYYLVDLVGSLVVLEGREIGRVVALRSDPTVETLVIELTDGTSAEQPLLDVWVGDFDRDARRLELRSDDGLIR